MGGGGGPEAEFYGGPAPRGWRTVPEGRAGGAQPESVAAELRGGLLLRPVPRSRGGGEESLGSILVRGHGRNFPAAAVFEPAGQGLLRRPVPRPRGGGKKCPGAILVPGARPELLSGGGF